MPQSWLEEIAKPIVLITGGAGGMWAVLKAVASARASEAVAKVKQPADLLQAMAAFQAALNSQAEAITADLREMVERQGDRIHELEAENEQCRGENRQMSQRLESLEALLRRRGIDLPGLASADSMTVIEVGGVTQFTPGGGQG